MTDAMFRVLVVEDDAHIRSVLRTLLESAGYRVELAENAARALVEARSNRPDAVLIDLGLPDRDGQQLIRDIRGFSTVPILVLSARSAEQQKILALDNGADDYVTKPFDAGELLARLRAALRRSVRASRPVRGPCSGSPDRGPCPSRGARRRRARPSHATGVPAAGSAGAKPRVWSLPRSR